MAKLNPVDLFDIRSLLSEEEQMIQDSVGRWVDERALPLMGDCFAEARFPHELIPEVAEMGLLGSSIEGYGCAGLNAAISTFWPSSPSSRTRATESCAS